MTAVHSLDACRHVAMGYPCGIVHSSNKGLIMPQNPKTSQLFFHAHLFCLKRLRRGEQKHSKLFFVGLFAMKKSLLCFCSPLRSLFKQIKCAWKETRVLCARMVQRQEGGRGHLGVGGQQQSHLAGSAPGGSRFGPGTALAALLP